MYRGLQEIIVRKQNMKDTIIAVPDFTTFKRSDDAKIHASKIACSLGLLNGKTVLYLYDTREVVINQENKLEIIKPARYYYDQKAFTQLGGRIYQQIGKWDITELEYTTLDNVFKKSLLESQKDIDIEHIGCEIVIEDNIDSHVLLANNIPLNQIVKYSKELEGKNFNMNNPLCTMNFFRGLLKYTEQYNFIDVDCNISDRYISFSNKNTKDSIDEDIMYEPYPDKLMGKMLWEKVCYNYTKKDDEIKDTALRKAGIYEAYIALEKYLFENDSIEQIQDINGGWPCDYVIRKRKLKYGYQLNHVKRNNDGTVEFKIAVYDRVINNPDMLKGMDDVELIYKNGMIYPLDTKATIKSFHKEPCEERDWTEKDILTTTKTDLVLDFKVVTLCGNLKFKNEFLELQQKLLNQKYIVLMPEFDSKLSSETLKLMHRQKIDMADIVYIVNPEGYIDEDVESEIWYAKHNYKQILYLEDKGFFDSEQ